MKTLPILLGLSCTALLFAACQYDDEDYRARSVSVSTGGAYYGGGYDEYSPYYSYSGRRYFRSGNRYVYYTDNRPYYVTALPSGANYITPRRSDHRTGSSVRTYRQEPAVPRYDTTSERRSYESQSDRSDGRERAGYSSEQRVTQTRVQSYPLREVRRESESTGVRVQSSAPSSPSREIRGEQSTSKVRAQTNVQSVSSRKIQPESGPSKVRVQTDQATVEATDGRPDKRKKQKDD